MYNVQVVEQGSPSWIVVEGGVRKSDQAGTGFREDRLMSGIGLTQLVSPHCHAVGDDVTIKERVGIRATVVSAPAVGVKRGDGLSIRGIGKTELQVLEICGVFLHRSSRSSGGDRACLQHHPEVVPDHPMFRDEFIGDAVDVNMLDGEAFAPRRWNASEDRSLIRAALAD